MFFFACYIELKAARRLEKWRASASWFLEMTFLVLYLPPHHLETTLNSNRSSSYIYLKDRNIPYRILKATEPVSNEIRPRSPELFPEEKICDVEILITSVVRGMLSWSLGR
jgi:hypothetical protein